MQLYAHNAHNTCKGDTFFSDHEELGSLYGTYEGAYDNVVERTLGLGKSLDLLQVQKDAIGMLEDKGTPTSFSSAFECLLGCEKELCELLEEANADATFGTQDLLQAMASDSEIRQYKFKHRLNKEGSEKEAAEQAPKEEADAAVTDKMKPSKIKLLTSKA